MQFATIQLDCCLRVAYNQTKTESMKTLLTISHIDYNELNALPKQEPKHIICYNMNSLAYVHPIFVVQLANRSWAVEFEMLIVMEFHHKQFGCSLVSI